MKRKLFITITGLSLLAFVFGGTSLREVAGQFDETLIFLPLSLNNYVDQINASILYVSNRDWNIGRR